MHRHPILARLTFACVTTDVVETEFPVCIVTFPPVFPFELLPPVLEFELTLFEMEAKLFCDSEVKLLEVTVT